MFKFDFLEILLKDKIVMKYVLYFNKIYLEIIINDNLLSKTKLKFKQIRTLLILVYTGNDKLELMNYIILSESNILTRHIGNHYIVISLYNKRYATEIKDLNK